MKTLIATIAVLFTMVTAASANEKETLGMCLVNAFVTSVALQNDITEEMIYAYIRSNAGASMREQLVDQIAVKIDFVVGSKFDEEPLSHVLNLMRSEDHVLYSLESKCIIDYYSESA
jgi:hypothetical protein